MNVKNDLTNVQGGTVASRTRGGVKAAAVRTGTTGESALQGVVRPGEQAIAGAFSMIQKAQSIVQQALAVSNRLRNIAAETMTGGNVQDAAGVSAEIAQVNAVLQDFGLEVTPPSTPAGTQERIDLRDVAGAVAEMQNYKTPSAGDQEQLAGIEARIGRVAAELERRVDETSRESGALSKTVNPVEVRGSVMAHPAEAIMAQGNLVPERIAGLLG